MSLDKITELLMGAKAQNDRAPYGGKSLAGGMAQGLFAMPGMAESKQRYDEQQKFNDMLKQANYTAPAAAAPQPQGYLGKFTPSDWTRAQRAKKRAGTMGG